MIFGHGQNHQNQTFKGSYQPKKSWFENYFCAKINTTMLLYLYQIFIFLLGHLHFFVDFFFTFMETTSMSCLFLHKNCFWIVTFWLIWPFQCLILIILTMAKYHENLLKDSTFSLLFPVKFFSSLKTKMRLKTPNETFSRNTRYMVRHWQILTS